MARNNKPAPVARTPYYSDPAFRERIQALNQPMQTMTGPTSPFAATQNAVAQRLAGNRGTQVNNQFSLAGANALRSDSIFQNNMKWGNYNANVARAGREITTQEALTNQRNAAREAQKAARKSGRRAMFGGALGAVGGAAGTLFGGPIGGAAGQTAGQSLGGAF